MLRHGVEIFNEIVGAYSRGEALALATVVKTIGSTPGKLGFKMLVYPDGRILGTVGGGVNETRVVKEAIEVIRTGEARLFSVQYEGSTTASEEPICGGSSEVFVEPVFAPLTLYIFGAGHVGQALARIGKTVGFRIVVIDDRQEFANKTRFPDVDDILLIDYGEARTRVNLTPKSCVVIITHGHKSDLEILRSFIQCDLEYIGMIGSKRKVEEIFATLRKDGISNELLKRVHAPIGLDIGADTPAEIAVSIISEIIAETKKRNCFGPNQSA
jgi:xanthine dehydrogenase accessory factor